MLLCVALPGCATKESVRKISLYPDTIGASVGQTVVLKAKANLLGEEKDWLYQWQYITGQTEEGNLIVRDIPEARCSKLVRKASLDDTQLYRCMIYHGGKLPETNYTAVLSLHVSRRSIMLSSVITTVSGSFKPGNGSGNSTLCKCSYKDGLVFQSPTGNWWLPPATASSNATITDNTTGINYANTPVFLQVSNENGPLRCWKLTSPQSSMQFPVNVDSGYMLCLYFAGPLPPAGAKFSFAIKW
jgi:hypothetical protein